MRRVLLALAGMIAAALAAGGCQSKPTSSKLTAFEQPLDLGLSEPSRFEPVDALVVVPEGWRAEPIKSSDRHKHQVWISPSGKTAYGVIRMRLPIPIGSDTLLHFGVIPEMKRTEGEAELISSEHDNKLPGTRFVAAGGRYLLRSNVMTRGWRGWVVYAGTLRDQDVDAAELELAELARERTVVGDSR